MNTRKIILVLSILLLFIVGYWSNKKIFEILPTTPIILPEQVEKFINKSALEIQNPITNLSATSSIDVTKKKAPPKMICQNNESSDFTCYENYYRDLVKTDGIKEAFADLKIRYQTNSYVMSQCHPLTHIIGQAAILKYPTATEAYLYGDAFCWSGYYHGALEGIMGKIGRNNIVSELNNICSAIPGKSNYSFDYYNCVHGLGHGLMAMTNTELFESLALCDNLSGLWEQTSCYGGVYMENVIVDNKNHFTKYLKPDDPLYPCNTVAEKYKSACYLMQTSYMLKVVGGDFTKVFALCEKADANYKTTCFQSLGRDASGRSVSDIESTKAVCDLGTNFEAKSNCIIGAVKDFISYHHSDLEAKNLCHSLDNPDLRSICLNTAENYYQSF